MTDQIYILALLFRTLCCNDVVLMHKRTQASYDNFQDALAQHELFQDKPAKTLARLQELQFSATGASDSP